MSECKYVLVESKPETEKRIVTLREKTYGIQVLVNGSLICALNHGRDYLDIYYADSSTGLKNDGTFLKTVK